MAPESCTAASCGPGSSRVIHPHSDSRRFSSKNSYATAQPSQQTTATFKALFDLLGKARQLSEEVQVSKQEFQDLILSTVPSNVFFRESGFLSAAQMIEMS